MVKQIDSFEKHRKVLAMTGLKTIGYQGKGLTEGSVLAMKLCVGLPLQSSSFTMYITPRLPFNNAESRPTTCAPLP